MRIYLAHPYTGDEEKNRERALRAEGLLRKATPQATFYNPVGRISASKQFAGRSYAEVMAEGLSKLTECDGIVFCGDWKESAGCRFEACTAKRLSLPRWYGVDAYVKMWRCVEIETQYEEVAL